jgi:hypothetical protein
MPMRPHRLPSSAIIPILALTGCGYFGEPNFYPSATIHVARAADPQGDLTAFDRMAADNDLTVAPEIPLGRMESSRTGTAIDRLRAYRWPKQPKFGVLIDRSVVSGHVSIHIWDNSVGGFDFPSASCDKLRSIVRTLRTRLAARRIETVEPSSACIPDPAQI